MAPRHGSEPCLGGARRAFGLTFGLRLHGSHARSPSYPPLRLSYLIPHTSYLIPHTLIPSYPHTLIPSYPHTSYPPSYPPLRLSRQVDELFVFSSRGQGGPVRLADTYTGEWLDARRLTLKAINARVTPGAVSGGDSQAAPTNLLRGGSSPLITSDYL